MRLVFKAVACEPVSNEFKIIEMVPMTKRVLRGVGLLAPAIFVYDVIVQVLLGPIVSLPQLSDGCVGR